MPAPMTRHGRDVTGRAKFRKHWTGKLVLMVEVADYNATFDHELRCKWIDADEGDMFALRYHRERLGLEPLL